MGIVLDIVPNHMAASSENPAWDDVLAHGPASKFARWFDIDWRATERELRSRVLLPVLGAPLTGAIQRGEIALESREGVPRVRYFEHDLPLDPSTLPPVLDRALDGCRQALHRRASGLQRAGRDRRHPSPAAAPHRAQRAGARPPARAGASRSSARLRELAARVPEVARGAARGRRRLPRPGRAPRPAPPTARRAGLSAGALAARGAGDQLPPVLRRRTISSPSTWRTPRSSPRPTRCCSSGVGAGWVDGFRIDHPDGLLDPLGYFQRLARCRLSGAARATAGLSSRRS